MIIKFNKTFIFSAMTIILVAVMSSVICAPPAVYASTAKSEVCNGVGLTSPDGTGCSVPAGSPTANSIVSTVVNILSIVVGILAVIYIIIGGIKYITSSGDANNV